MSENICQCGHIASDHHGLGGFGACKIEKCACTDFAWLTVTQRIESLEAERDAIRAERDAARRGNGLLIDQGAALEEKIDALQVLLKDAQTTAAEMQAGREDAYRQRNALRAEVERLKTSMVEHFQRDHLAGDGPEIDRWRARVAELESALRRMVDAVDAVSHPDRDVSGLTLEWEKTATAMTERLRRAERERDHAKGDAGLASDEAARLLSACQSLSRRWREAQAFKKDPVKAKELAQYCDHLRARMAEVSVQRDALAEALRIALSDSGRPGSGGGWWHERARSALAKVEGKP